LDVDKKHLTYYAQIIENSGRRITTVIDDIIDISRKYEGSGLGLAVSSGIIDRLGGKIRVESKVGQGTVFYFMFPFH
jgi:signal transduction histidine kinase